ncbi:hypothetical protein O3P69_008199 [Scylla paramamosain]|uniref:Uncharacterized protein n=1 Tax=Scylla paramamosain TaxID=85552 RepID=A0AAW0T1R1_SCYPA
MLASGEDGTTLAGINMRMDDVVKTMEALKDTITAQNSVANENYEKLRARVNKQIIAKQQQYLEYLDKKEREGNVVILGVPDDQESLEGATTDEEKLDKIWTAVAHPVVVFLHTKQQPGSAALCQSFPCPGLGYEMARFIETAAVLLGA